MVTWKSQFIQDRWVAEPLFKGMTGGFFVDIGAHDGVWLSNTYALEKSFGWTGILIEADELYASQIAANRNAKVLNVCLDEGYGKVQFFQTSRLDGVGGIIDTDTDTTPEVLAVRQASGRVRDVVEMDTLPLVDVLSEHGAPMEIDYLSIDVEGAEYRILAKFPFSQYAFKTMTIERPSAALQEILIREGYVVVLNYKEDLYYVHRELVDVSTARFDTARWFGGIK